MHWIFQVTTMLFCCIEGSRQRNSQLILEYHNYEVQTSPQFNVILSENKIDFFCRFSERSPANLNMTQIRLLH